jgi:hypothetical protein
MQLSDDARALVQDRIAAQPAIKDATCSCACAQAH